MSTQYNTEPPPTASVLLQTTAGPLTISLFANQTPLTCRNFLQHVLDGTYKGNIFHRISPGFVIQSGDPTGTGEGGENIYEDREFEDYDEHWARIMGREKGEKIVFKDEIHSRLKFNRRGLVGMAKGTGDGLYGSQFFITLGDCRAQLDGRCTMFGRIEGDGIYNIVKIAEGELVDGTERPVYPEKIISAEVLDMPTAEAWKQMKKRQKISQRVIDEPTKKKAIKKKGGKGLLSFGGDDGEDDNVVVKPKKAKFNTALISNGDESAVKPAKVDTIAVAKSKPTRQKPPSSSPEPPSRIPQKRKISTPPSSPNHRRKPSFHDPTTQLPLRDPESPSRSPTPSDHAPQHKSQTKSLEAEIAALKASMRRDVGSTSKRAAPKSALEGLIPETSTRGRKRPKPGESNTKDDKNALKLLNAFKARLDNAAPSARPLQNGISSPALKTLTSQSNDKDQVTTTNPTNPTTTNNDDNDQEEATLCDLHFIANCQSCRAWDLDMQNQAEKNEEEDEKDGKWMNHSLTFEKDRLGKDLTWKKKGEEELVVIDPREKEREVKHSEKERRRNNNRTDGRR